MLGLAVAMAHSVSAAITPDANGYLHVSSGSDLKTALTQTQTTIVFDKDINVGSGYTVTKSTTFDFNGHAMFATQVNQWLTVTGSSNIVVKNMYMANNTATAAGTSLSLSIPSESGTGTTTGVAASGYGVFYGAVSNPDVNKGNLTFQDCTWSFPNVGGNNRPLWWEIGHVIFKGTNVFNCGGDREFGIGYAFEVQDGVTTFNETPISSTYNSINTGQNANKASDTDPMLVSVNQGATLNWSSNRGNYIWWGDAAKPILWNVNGTFNYSNSNTTARQLFTNAIGTFTCNVGAKGVFNFKAPGPLFQLGTFNQAVTMTAADGAKLAIENTVGAGVISGLANTYDKFNLGKVASAKFASAVAPVFGASDQSNFTLNTTDSVQVTSYADRAATNVNLSMPGNGPMTIHGGYATPWAANYTAANMTTLQNSLAHVFGSAKGLGFMDDIYGTNTFPTAFSWSASLQNLPTDGSNVNIARDTGNTMTLGIYDDRDTPSWTLAAAVSPLVNNGNAIQKNAGATINPLVWSQGGVTLPLSAEATGVLSSQNSQLTVNNGSDYTITLPENEGLLASLNRNMLAGEFIGTITWTLNDGIQ